MIGSLHMLICSAAGPGEAATSWAPLEGGWPVLSEAAAESAGACTMAVIWMEQSAQHTAVLGILRADSVQICLNSCGLTDRQALM